MPPRKRRKSRHRTPEMIACTVHVQRGGVSVQVEHIMLSQAAEVASYLLDLLEAKRARHPELSRPHEVVQIGGYHPVDASDDDTEARKQVGF